ncbi:hypothetical protein AC241_27335 (plasmid) [Bacillus thuringiensis]|uniref:hypothetical protein n=1 Tax=Bacillus thuringiensis TaxID=1428 RepID=UPI000676E57D|nr:hypothetical protein [Bacillus thuringiensis]AKR12475.1 hypothetical protein AC241_27335 [Bacillus thuringiensis]
MIEKVKEFEKVIDQKLENLSSLKCSGVDAVKMIIAAIETSYISNSSTEQFLKKGLDILLPYYVNNSSNGNLPNAKRFLKDLEYASHYFMLREFLYYSYNTSDSIEWKFNKRKVKIGYKDSSIPRQFFLIADNYFSKSQEIFSDYSPTSEKIISLLKPYEEFTDNQDAREALELIKKEAELKINNYYNFINDHEMSSITLGTYNLKEMFEVIKSLLIKALYHRYYSRIHKNPIPVIVSLDEIAQAIHEESSLSLQKCRNILLDITYRKGEKINPVYFPLYYFEETNEILMSPHIFCQWEAYVNVLRLIALRNNKIFQNQLSSILSDNFVNKIESLFKEQGFICKTNVDLQQFDTSLPDIDLLIVSEEPALGYVVYCCEVKNPIPPQWAKDHLRVLNKDSVIKSFSQIKKIDNFLHTEQGINFIRSILPTKIPTNLNNNFLVVVNHLIITSNNSGMFFTEKNQTIIDYNTLSRILKNSDGDIAYIMHLTKTLNKHLDNCYSKQQVELKIDNLKVNYEGVAIKHLLDFPQNRWKSNGTDQKLLEEFINEGLHPFDMFDELQEKDD